MPQERADARRNRARILAAAEAVFAERGPAASTEEIAARAGVAVGTVFRHFPTKRDLLVAILKDLRDGLMRTADAFAEDPGDGLFRFLAHVVEEAAAKRTVVALLADAGTGTGAAEPVRALRGTVDDLLARAQRAGRVRPDVGTDEVLALLTAACQGALQAGWDADLRRRTLGVILDGLRARG